MAREEHNDRNLKRGLIGLGVALALGLLGSAALVSATLSSIKRTHLALEVKGYAERDIESDYATWTGTFTTRAPDLETAYQDLARQRGSVREFLAAQGVPHGAFELDPVTTAVLFAQNERGGVTNRVEGYALSQQVRLASRELDLVATVAERSSELVRQGIEFAAYRPQYFYAGLGALKIDMLAEATRDAHRRAEVLAEQSGGRIGSLLSARQGVFQITPAHSTEVSDYGRNDTSSRQKSIKAVVTVRYAVGR